MRRLITFLAAAMLITAQTALAHNAAIGIEGGPNVSSAFVDPDVGSGFNTGLVLGLTGDLRLAEPWYLEISANWVTNGSEIEIGGQEAEITFDYAELPVRIKWLWLNDSPIVPFAFAGASFGFVVDATGDTDVAIVDFQEELNDEFTNFDIGLDAGAGVNWDLTRHLRLFLRGRYTPWFLDITEDTNVLGFESWRNQDIKISVGGLWLFGPQSAY